MPVKIYKRKLDKKPGMGPKAQWSDKQKLDACSTYLLTGSWAATSAATLIPVDTIKKWGASQWWKDMEEEVKRASRIETQGKLKRILDKSMAHLEDRLDNGDFVYNSKTGKIQRRPIPARTLSTVVSNSVDKAVLLEKLQTAPTQNQDQISTRLAKIQEEFQKFSKARTITNAEFERVQERGKEVLEMPSTQTSDQFPSQVQETDASILVQTMSQSLESQKPSREAVLEKE